MQVDEAENGNGDTVAHTTPSGHRMDPVLGSMPSPVIPTADAEKTNTANTTSPESVAAAPDSPAESATKIVTAPEQESPDSSSLDKPVGVNKRIDHRKLFQDCISVRIPLHATADLGVAVKRTRTKRVKALHAAFPTLRPKQPTSAEVSDTNQNTPTDDGKGESVLERDDPNEPKNAKKKLKHVPQPHEFASVLDYLEAKYVQGVMVDDEEATPGGDGTGEDEEDDEGQGSVYSQTSFLDDTDLRRNVAEQVLANTTTTKLELQGDEAGEFFVNVGNLEVEETELTKDQYDPLQDTNDAKSTKRKRKKPVKETVSNGNGAKSLKKTSVKSTPSLTSPKKKAKGKDEGGGPPSSGKASTGSNEDVALLEITAADKRTTVDSLFETLVDLVNESTEDELPRRKLKDKVAVTCPVDKNPGDSILFSNPHVPGQRLKVKIPKNTKPGGTFKVTVPVAPPLDDDDTDHNKLTRTFHDTLDDFSRAYDEWCDIKGEISKVGGDEDFAIHTEKRNKFDDLAKAFPKDLKTPVDKGYLQKLLRRARQNRYKRELTAQKHAAAMKADEDAAKRESSPKKKKAKLEATSPAKSTTDLQEDPLPTMIVPHLASEFPTKAFHTEDF
jgi:hypothetical protein